MGILNLFSLLILAGMALNLFSFKKAIHALLTPKPLFQLALVKNNNI